jgi:hypothetical protein
VDQLDTEMRIASWSCQRVPPSQHVRSSCARLITARVKASASPPHLVADVDTDLWSALQSVLLDVPADAPQHCIPRRREACEVGHLAAGHEADARGLG